MNMLTIDEVLHILVKLQDVNNNIVQVGTTPFGVPVLNYDGSNYTRDVSGNLTRYTGTINSLDWGE